MAEVDYLLMEVARNRGEEALPPGFVPIESTDTFNPAQIDEALENIRYNLSLGVPTLRPEEAKDGACIIVGGAPSINRLVERIRSFDRPGNIILAMNDAVLWLAKHGITAHGCVVREIESDGGARLLKNPPDCTYYIASNAHRCWVDGLHDKAVFWHCPNNIGDIELIHDLDPNGCMITGGVSAALRSIGIGRALGYSKFHMFGVDSSAGDDLHGQTTHAYEDRPNEQDGCFDVWAHGRRFRATGYWIKQARHLVWQVGQYAKHGMPVHVAVHGDGLLPHLAKHHGIPVFN